MSLTVSNNARSGCVGDRGPRTGPVKASLNVDRPAHNDAPMVFNGPARHHPGGSAVGWCATTRGAGSIRYAALTSRANDGGVEMEKKAVLSLPIPAPGPVTAVVAEGRPNAGLLQRARQEVAARPLGWFFVLAFVFSWATWPIVLATGSGPPVLGFGPFLAAVLVLALAEGKSGVGRLLRAMVRWRVAVRWWATALLLPVVLTGAAAVLNVAMGAPAPTAELDRWPNALVTAVVILCIPVIGGAWEEPGWRGFALPRLLGRFSPSIASLLLGMVWALWHLPLLSNGDQHWSDLVLVILAAIVFTWVFGNARASVLVAMVMHAMNNAVSGEYVSLMFTGADSTRQSWLLVLVWGIAALAVAAAVRGFRSAP